LSENSAAFKSLFAELEYRKAYDVIEGSPLIPLEDDPGDLLRALKAIHNRRCPAYHGPDRTC
jgi:hypothetical protein